jgi:hypothetical protein
VNEAPPLPTILGLTSAEIASLVEQEARQRVGHLPGRGQAGSSSGSGQDAHRLTMHTADGQHVKYHVGPDGRRTLIAHDVA